MKEKEAKVDWILLIFLILLANQAILSLKLLGLLFVYAARFDWNFGFTKGRLPKFYLFILIQALITFFLITRDFNTDYIVAFLVGCSFWFLSLMASHQVKWSVEHKGSESILRTMKVFIVLHFITCLLQLVRMIAITGKLNPYEGLPFPYGMSAGDNIYGILLENSYYNIMVSSLLAVYFLFKKSVLYALIAITSLVLVFGNFGTIIFMSVLTVFFGLGLLFSNVDNRYWGRRIILPGKTHLLIPFIGLFIGILYISISPSNYSYVLDKVKAKVFRIKKEDKNNYASMLDNQKPSEKAFDQYRSILDDTEKVNHTVTFAAELASNKESKLALTRLYISNLQGKNLSVFETIAYLKSGIQPLLFGAGTARFSSSAAQKLSGLDSSRLFMNVLPHYKSDLYADNHYLLIQERNNSKDKALYSTANWPDSTYNEIFGEYGIIGGLLFVFFYIGYFIKRYKQTTYTLWLLLLVLFFAHLNYTFDTLCVIPFFELLAFADIQENKTNIQTA